MKASEVTVAIVKEYLRLDFDDDILLQLVIDGAKSYIKSYTGIKTDEDLDKKEDLTIAFLVLIEEMYDNRSYTVQGDKLNKLVDNILGMYSINLL